MQQVVTVMDVRPGEALVRGRRSTACGSCAGKASCGTLGSWVERYAEMRVVDPLGAKIGDEVSIEVPDGEFMRAALRLYGAPMLGFFVAGFAARAAALSLGLGAPEVWAAAGALVGMFGVFLWLRGSKSERPSGARIVQILPRSEKVTVLPSCH